jgi:hypothetical protein
MTVYPQTPSAVVVPHFQVIKVQSQKIVFLSRRYLPKVFKNEKVRESFFTEASLPSWSSNCITKSRNMDLWLVGAVEL